jgi:membrane associated rhomboid family serine protease
MRRTRRARHGGDLGGGDALFCALLKRRSNPYTLGHAMTQPPRPTPTPHPQQPWIDEDLEDRDYANRPLPREAYRSPALGSVTMWIIGINVAIYLLDELLRLGLRIGYVMQVEGYPPLEMGPLQFWGHFSQYFAIENLQLWRFVTFQFLHGGVHHLAFNMLALYFFGPLVEFYLRPRQFLVYYLLSGVGGALFYLVLLMLGYRIGTDTVPLVGASAGIFGVLVAAALIAPNAMVYLFGIVPMQLVTLAYFFIIYAVLQVLFRGANAGGEAAHLGGAAAGVLLMRHPNWLERIGWAGRRAPPF